MAKLISDEDIRLNIIVNGSAGQKELLDLEKSTRKLNTTQKELRAEKARLIAAGKKESQEYKNITAEIKKNNAVINTNKARMQVLQKEIGITGLTMSQLKKKAKLLRMQLDHVVPGGEAEKNYNAQLKKIGARLTELKAKGRQTKISLSGIANGFNKYAALGASVIATSTGVVLGFQKMIDYNGKLSDSQADVMKTTGLTKKEVDELTKSFGLLNTRTSRINLLKIAEEGGRIGIAKEEIGDFVRVMNKANVALGDSFEGGPEEVASKLGKLKLLFKETKNLRVDKAYEAIGSAINELGANGVATETNIASFATRVGSLPDNLKPAIQDALGLGAAFEESGVQAEISGRAYSIFLGQAAANTEKFAKVMGISNQEVQDLINEDPVEFFLQFSQKLNDTSKGGVDTALTLKELGLSADGVKKIVGAAGNNVDRFRELLTLSNKSMVDATSLTKEYDLKNNNLAATIEKVEKKLMAWFSSDFIIGGLSTLIAKFGVLIGAVKDVNEEFAKESKTTFESAKNTRRLAIESENLLKKYNSLRKEGVTPTIEEKIELDKITIQLKDRLGDSVIAIDKQTGSFKLNTKAVKEQIRIKSLMADEEAVILISRKIRTKEAKAELEAELPTLERQYLIRKKIADEARKELRASDEYQNKNQKARLSSIANLEAVKAERDAFLELSKQKGKITEQTLREIDLTQKLRDLNVSETDEKSLFKVDQPKEGETKFEGNTKFVFKNGSWVVVKTKNPPPDTGDEELTPEDKAIVNSKKKLAQFIEDWNNDQDLKKLLKDEEKEAAEILKKEEEYEKKILEAENDVFLTSELEEIKEAEIQSIKDKWAEIRLEKKKEEDEKFAKLDEKQKQRLIAAEEQLEAAKRNLLNGGVAFLGGVFGRKSAIYKLMFGLEQAFAVNDIIINSSKAIAQVKANLAIANGKAIAAAPISFGMPYTAINSGIAAKEILATKLSAGAQIGSIIGASLQGFEGGLYENVFPVTRSQDGKKFNARFGGQTTSGVVDKPTVFMAGENGPELIVDARAFRQINPDIRNSFQREIARVKGFEVGLYNNRPPVTNVTPEITEVASGEPNDAQNETLVTLLEENITLLRTLNTKGVIASMSSDLRTVKKLQERLDDYKEFNDKNKR